MNYAKLFSLAVLALALGNCDKDDDDDNMPTPQPKETASMTVNDQTTSQNMVEVELADVPSDGWIVIHKDDNGSPVVPDIVSEPKFIQEGENMKVKVAFNDETTLMDGEKVWVMLHEDTGMPQQYEFDGQSGEDAPFTKDGNPVMSQITIESASIMVSNQAATNNMVTIDRVVAAQDGWLVVHNDDGTGNIVLPDIIGKTMVQKGVNTDVQIQLDQNVMLQSGQKLFPMLHLDNGQIGVYEFDGSGEFDGPEIFGNEAFPNNVIFTSFEVM
jgi:hypothetical protein